MIRLSSPDQVDLSRNAVIEASAGTGKTYTIENLVHRLVVERGVSIKSILVVTYTEKAAGEMNFRIREKFRKSLAKDRGNVRLRQALLDFDAAQISTIHSFCLRMLRELSFEMGLPRGLDQVDDTDIHEEMLHKRMRVHWSEDADASRALYENSESPLDTITKPILKALELYTPQGGDSLLPKSRDAEVVTPHFLARETEELERHADSHKLHEGTMSFRDMLIRVARMLAEPGSLLLEAIRARYTYALVDEFQDTDPVQWQIFRRAFLDSMDHRLFLIGDPKQAIYSFRGGDIHTYLDAREEVVAMRGLVYTLDTNWRSTSEMIEVFNCLFTKTPWFPPEETICHEEASAPGEILRLNHMLQDPSGRGALSFIPLPPDNAAIARAEYVSRLAAEVLHLTGANAPLIRLKGRERRLGLDDIAILVDRKMEVPRIQRALANRGIPSMFYRKEGVYQSDEALQLWCLLSGLSHPQESQGFRICLLSSFINCAAEDAANCGDWPGDHPLRVVYTKWRSLGEQRNWAAFFRSVFLDGGLFARLAGTFEWERTVTNYRQIAEDLELRATRNKWSITEIVTHLSHLRANAAELEKDQAIHRIESEQAKVRIMTIHTSKGLEFPVVFVFGGLTASRTGDVTRYHADEGGYVLDFAKEPSSKDAEKRDRLSEARRLYYVAITRAIFKLYIPLYKPKRAAGVLVKPLGDIFDNVIEIGVGSIVEQPPAASRPSIVTKERKRRSPVRLDSTGFANRRVFRTSFSRLKERQVSSNSFRPFDDPASDKIDSDESGSLPFRRSSIPGGTGAGNAFHSFFEEFDHTQLAGVGDWRVLLGEASILSLMIRCCRRNGLQVLPVEKPEDSSLLREFAETIHAALTADLPDPFNGPFQLSGITDRLVEAEFLIDMGQPFGAKSRTGDVTGFVDLVFRRQNLDGSWRYYLLDWKSNTLPGYSPQDLEDAMREAGYTLQAEIYQYALARWLEERLGAAYDPAVNLGGAYYLFLRGIVPGKTDGIHVIPPPTREALADTPARLHQLFNTGGA